MGIDKSPARRRRDARAKYQRERAEERYWASLAGPVVIRHRPAGGEQLREIKSAGDTTSGAAVRDTVRDNPGQDGATTSGPA